MSLMIIDGTDNIDYFIYKFNISKKDQKRLLFLNNFYSQKIIKTTFSIKNLDKILYYNGKEALMDVIYYKIFKSKKIDNNLITMIKDFENKKIPIMPLQAITLMTKYNIPEGKDLGSKLKRIEESWVNNNFQIDENELQKIINN